MPTIKERGWAGHFCAASSCRFRRNTLIEDSSGFGIVVSTVGAMFSDERVRKLLNIKKGAPEEIGHDRVYETMCFEADSSIYKDANVGKPIYSDDLKWAISMGEFQNNKDRIDSIANDMQDNYVNWVVENFKDIKKAQNNKKEEL